MADADESSAFAAPAMPSEEAAVPERKRLEADLKAELEEVKVKIESTEASISEINAAPLELHPSS
jgi:hypothetical protein